MPKFSVITPVMKWNSMLEQMLRETLKAGSSKDIEIIIVSDEEIKDIPDEMKSMVKVIVSGKKTPAEKRNIGVENSAGEIIAFIDDDAYPEKNWFDVAERELRNDEVGAVGGPNLTPPDADEMEIISGLVYGSLLGGGGTRFRYVKGKRKMLIDDYPTCNLFVKRKAFESVGGFNLDYWPGEDSFFCNELVKKGWKIVYEPELVIYHHRRKAILPHLKQVWRYATTRGFFARKFGGNSVKLTYFLPSLTFTAGLIVVILTFTGTLSLWIITAGAFAYLTALIINSITYGANTLKRIALTTITTALTHLTYALGFIKGFVFPRKKAYFGR